MQEDVETTEGVLAEIMAAADETLIAHIRSRRRAWTAAELADVLSMSAKHILKMAKEQRMPSYRIGGSVRFDPSATADWLERRSVG
jgi:excisionase family DNA binding protein